MKAVSSFLLCLIISTNTLSQEPAVEFNEIKRHSLEFHLLGAPAWPIGLSYNESFNKRLSLEVGLGLGSTGLGFEYFITDIRKRRWNLKTGAFCSYIFDTANPPIIFYVPVGMTYLGKKHFQYSFDIGAVYAPRVTTLFENSDFDFWFGLAIGKRFGEAIQYDAPKVEFERRNILSVKIGGYSSPLIGVDYERLLCRYFGMEGTIGLLGASAGANVYFPGLRYDGVSFKAGARYGIGLNPWEGPYTYLYIPIGVSVAFKSNLILSIDAGPDLGQREMGASLKIGILL